MVVHPRDMVPSPDNDVVPFGKKKQSYAHDGLTDLQLRCYLQILNVPNYKASVPGAS